MTIPPEDQRSLLGRLRRPAEPAAAPPEPPARRPKITQEWIAELAAGRSFVDIGGLWGTVNERVSDAALAGASSVTMVDKLAQSHRLWGAFLDRAEELSVGDVRCVTADVTDRAAAIEAIGRHDIVHCSGIVYHLPDPIGLLSTLRALATEYVILVSMVVPERLETEEGTLVLEGGTALFVPGLDADQLRIVRAHCRTAGLKPRTIMEWESQVWLDENGKPLGPWWWLFTPTVLRGMISACGLELVDDGPQGKGRSHAFLCRVPR